MDYRYYNKKYVLPRNILASEYWLRLSKYDQYTHPIFPPKHPASKYYCTKFDKTSPSVCLSPPSQIQYPILNIPSLYRDTHYPILNIPLLYKDKVIITAIELLIEAWEEHKPSLYDAECFQFVCELVKDELYNHANLIDKLYPSGICSARRAIQSLYPEVDTNSSEFNALILRAELCVMP